MTALLPPPEPRPILLSLSCHHRTRYRVSGRCFSCPLTHNLPNGKESYPLTNTQPIYTDLSNLLSKIIDTFRKAEKLVSVLKFFGLDDPILTPEIFLQKPKIIRMGSPPIRLEITTSISGVEFEECYIDKLDGVDVSLTDLENLRKQESKRENKRHC